MYVVIAGGGKIGSYLATVLLNSGNEVAVIEESMKTADKLSVEFEGDYLVICGDCCDSRFQEDAGIRKADVFVAATGKDDSNLVSCEVAQRVFHVPRCVARVNNPRNIRIFREVGIECVSATTLIASMIEEEALLGSVSVVSALSDGNVSLAEMTVPRGMHHYDESEGVLADDVPMPEGTLIAAVSTKDGIEVVGEHTRLLPGVTAIVIAESDKLDDVRAVFRAL